MLKNNIEMDVKMRCIEAGTTQTQIAQNIGTTPSNVNKLIRSKEQIMNKTFLAMMEDLGYDVRLVYEKREGSERRPGMSKYKVCNLCHIAFDSRLNNCPSCGNRIYEEKEKRPTNTEGAGRALGVGGEACDYCPHCYGTADWCPIMDSGD